MRKFWDPQPYDRVSTDRTELRVREEGKLHYLTVNTGHEESRGEEEIAITRKPFEALWPLTRGRWIRKVRHRVPHDGVTIEVDVYRKRLKGPIAAEFEFPNDAAARDDFHPTG